MSLLTTKFKKSGYFKALVVLASGSFIGAAITGISEIVATWIYPAADRGAYTFLTAVPLLFISITSLRYDISIVVEKDERKALALVKLSAIIAAVVSIGVTIYYSIYLLALHSDYAGYWYVIPLTFLIIAGYGINNILNAYCNREKEYSTISRKYVMRTAVQRIGQLLLGLVVIFLLKKQNLAVLAMVAPYSLGLFAGVVNQSKGLRERWAELKSITWSEMLNAGWFHRKQVYYSTPALFINSYSYTVITLQIESIFDREILGYYSISNRVLGIPIALVAGNIAKVYIEEAAKEYGKTGKFINAFKKSFLFLIAIAVPMFFAMYFLAPPVCARFLGKGYIVAGGYIRILALMFSFRLIGTALSQSLAVCSRQGMELAVNLGLVGASLLSGFVTRAISGDIYFFLRMICISRSICYVFLILCVWLCARGTLKNRKSNNDADISGKEGTEEHKAADANTENE